MGVPLGADVAGVVQLGQHCHGHGWAGILVPWITSESSIDGIWPTGKSIGLRYTWPLGTRDGPGTQLSEC